MILEGLDLADPRPPDDLAAAVRARYPTASDDEVARIGALVEAYCSSEIARRLAGLPGATVERSFAFEQDGVLIHGRLDVFHEADGKALVVDYKTNVLEDASPAEVVEREYRIQRLVYALAILRAGASEVEVVYQFLERPSDLVTDCYKAEDVPASEARVVRGDRGDSGRRVQADAERVRVLDLPRAQPRLRRPEPAWRVAASRGAPARRPEKRADPAGDPEALAAAPGRDNCASVSLRPRAPRLRDALRADDRRERQPRHADAVPEVPPTRRTTSRCRSRSSRATSVRPGSSARRRSRSAGR